MKHIFIVFTMLALVASVSFAQMDRSPSQSPESFTPAMNPNAVYDLQFDYDAAAVTGANGNAGAIFFDNAAAGGPQFWTSRWSVPANQFHSWNPNGTLRAAFTIPGVTGPRGITYDGTYLYASSGAASIYKIDPVTKTLVSTITCQGGVTTRMLTYDPVRDGFWTAAFAGNISCVNRSGAVIATIPNTMVAKYGSAYDSWSPGGPYLWVFDQTNTAGGTPQNIYKLSLTTLTGARLDSFNVLLRVTTGGAAPIAGGLFIATGLVPSKVTIGGLLQGVPDRLFGLELATSAADTVLPFNLVSPAAAAKITTLPGSTTPVVISWDTNRVGVTFKWIFGSPTVPPRRFTLPNTTNTLTTTLGTLDAMLAAGGVAQGDSLIGQWDVWAFRNNPTNDSLKSTNGPRSITLKRGRPTLSAFSLVSPPSGTTVVTSSVVTTPISFVWNKSGDGATYRWKFATPTFPGTIRLNVSTAADTFATFPSFRLDSLVAGLGVIQGDSIVGQWRAYAYGGTDSLASTQTFNVTFRRDTPPATEPHYYNLNTGTSSNSFPFNVAGGKAVNSIFLAGEFNQPTPLPAGQAITRVYFRTSTAGTRTFTNLHILMAQDTITTLTTGTFYPGPYDTVYFSPSATLTSTVGGWMGVTLDRPFAYNPTKSLITFVGQCGSTATGPSVYNSTLTGIRRTWSIGGCPFVPFATGGDASMVNFGVGVVPAQPSGFFNNFESYTAGQRLACQDSVNWTTWSLLPCNTTEDPLISNAFAFSGTRSVVIVQNNDLVKRLGNDTTGIRVITFKFYVPTSKAGYFNTLATFTPPSTFNWGMEAYFDSAAGGNNGRLLAGSSTAVPFAYTHNAWQTARLVVNLNIDSARFVINGNVIRTWRWTAGASGGTSPRRLAANDFFGATAWDQMYMDDYDYHPDVVWTGVDELNPEIPGTFALEQNYPNPFNPTTTLRYALPKDARVTLSIYNVLGQRVATLKDEVQNVGYHDVVWNGRNDFGSQTASGVYFYRIEAKPVDGGDVFTSIKKMLLLK